MSTKYCMVLCECFVHYCDVHRILKGAFFLIFYGLVWPPCLQRDSYFNEFLNCALGIPTSCSILFTFQAFTTFGGVFGQSLNSVLFWPFYSLKIPMFVKIYFYVNEVSESENNNSFEISEQNGTTCRYAQRKILNFIKIIITLPDVRT